MKTSKNGKSLLTNLCEIIASLTSDELNYVKNSFNEGKEDSTYIKTLELIQKNSTKISLLENSNEELKFKKSLAGSYEITENALAKRFENLYAKLIEFLTDQYIDSKYKKWQIEAEKELLKIEALSQRENYPQAAALLLKLEEKILPKKEFHKSVFDDINIYLRMAHLKFELSQRTDFLSLSEQDDFLNLLLMSGDFIYGQAIPEDNLHQFERSQFIGNKILANYFISKNEFDIAKKKILRAKHHLDCNEKITNNEYELCQTYLEALQTFIEIKTNGKLSNENLDIYKTNDLTFIKMLFDLFVDDAKAILLLNKFTENEKITLESAPIKYAYTPDIIEEYSIRKEINYCIATLISGYPEKCLENINFIKKEGIIKNRKNPIKLKIEFLELIAAIKNGSFELDAILRRIVSILKITELAQDYKFEKLSLKLFKKFTKKTAFGRKQFYDQFQNEVDELTDLQAIHDPVQILIINLFRKGV